MIQRRIDGTENFYRPWSHYKAGFGNAAGEYWLGEFVSPFTEAEFDLVAGKEQVGLITAETVNLQPYRSGKHFIAGHEEKR